MSLIQDALRRQMEENEKKSQPNTTGSSQNESLFSTAIKLKSIDSESNKSHHYDNRSSNGYKQDDKEPYNEEKTRSKPIKTIKKLFANRTTVLLALLVIVSILAGGYLWLTLGKAPSPKTKVEAKDKVENKGTAELSSEKHMPKEETKIASSDEGGAKMVITEEQKAEKKSAPESKEQRVVDSSKPVLQEKAQPQTALKEGQATVLPVAWPDLKLSGVLRGIASGQGAARINGKMIFVGGEIEGVKLIEVKDDGVVLEFGGERKFLKVGGILY